MLRVPIPTQLVRRARLASCVTVTSLLVLQTAACHPTPLPPPVPVEGWSAGSPEEEALAVLAESWWPAMLRRDTRFFNRFLDSEFRWAGFSQAADVPRERLAAALEGAYCGQIVYEITGLLARSLRQAGGVTSRGTVWMYDEETNALMMQTEFVITLLFRRAGRRWLITEAHVLEYQHHANLWREPNFTAGPARQYYGGPITPPARLHVPCPRGEPRRDP